MHVSGTARRACAVAALLACFSLAGWPSAVTAQNSGAGAAPQRLPSLGEPDAADMTEGSERRIGDLVMRSVRRDAAWLDDPLLQSHIEALWMPLLNAARARGEVSAETEDAFAWEVFLVRERSINAFALPGGFVGVHLGLIAASVAQDELAAVLAHELAHVTQRHILRSNSSARRQSMLGMVAMLAGILAAARTNSADMAQASIMGSQAAVIQGQLNFSRDMEREADRVGFTLMTDAGYAPEGVGQMFERLDKANRLNDNGQFPYLRSHPLTIERIGEARARAQSYEERLRLAGLRPAVGAAPFGALPTPQRHSLMRARARVLMDTSVPALRHWQQQSVDTAAPAEQAGVLYGTALASVVLGEPARAAQALRALAAMRLDPSVADMVALLAADVAMAGGNALLAWRALQAHARASDRAAASTLPTDQKPGGQVEVQARRFNPARPLLMAQAEAALRWTRESSGQAAAVKALREQTDLLTTWVIENPRDVLAWSLIGQASPLLGHPLRGLRAEAEARWASGDLNGALDRFKAAQRMARASTQPDHVEASVIDARARQLERERRRAFADMRGVREEDLPPVLPPNVPL